MDPQARFTADVISTSARAYATGAVERMLAEGVPPGTSVQDAEDWIGDGALLLQYVAEAVACGRAELFTGYVRWLKVALAAREQPLERTDAMLRHLGAELAASLPRQGGAAAAVALLEAGRRTLQSAMDTLPSVLGNGSPHVVLARRYLLAVLEARPEAAVSMVLEAHAGGVSAADLHRHVLGAAQQELGRMWQMREVHVGEEHLGTLTTARTLDLLSGRVVCAPSNGVRVLCASVGGDLHDLGLRSVGEHLRWAGFDTILLGASTPAPDLLLALADFAPDLLALGASMPLHVRATASLIAVVRELGPRPKLPILVGGAPFGAVPDLYHVVGADACAGDGPSAVATAKRLVRLA